VQNVNVVVITGNLTKDPELRYTGEGGTPLTEIRVAVNGRRKDPATGEWGDKPNFFNVVVFGGRAEAIVHHLCKGSGIAIEGRLDWQEWDATDGSGKRQAVKIIAENTQFLGGKSKDRDTTDATASSNGDRQPVAVGAGGGDDDIPF
jgi:single-strand DNA-binding protein